MSELQECPETKEVSGFVTGAIIEGCHHSTPEQREKWITHLESCKICETEVNRQLGNLKKAFPKGTFSK